MSPRPRPSWASRLGQVRDPLAGLAPGDRDLVAAGAVGDFVGSLGGRAHERLRDRRGRFHGGDCRARAARVTRAHASRVVGISKPVVSSSRGAPFRGRPMRRREQVASAVTTGPAAEIGSAATLVIQQKLVVPPLSETRVARPRVESRLAELIDAYRVVAVLATAGAGKTTAVAAAAELLDRPIAWLTHRHAGRRPRSAADLPRGVAGARRAAASAASSATRCPPASGTSRPRACWRMPSATSGSSSSSTTWSGWARRGSRGS